MASDLVASQSWTSITFTENTGILCKSGEVLIQTGGSTPSEGNKDGVLLSAGDGWPCVAGTTLHYRSKTGVAYIGQAATT